MKLLKKIKNSPKVIFLLAVLLIGTLYYIFIKITGFAFPCAIKTVTGFDCPSCGISRMCIAIIHLDFKRAFHENMMLMIMIPLWIIAAFLYNFKLTKKTYRNSTFFKVCFIISAVIFIAFGILRNIPVFSFLKPI